MPAVRIFQSTLPQGERLYVATNSSICIDFNPRSRKGSDVGCQYASGAFSYFNPRSRKGSDACPQSLPLWPRNFNPRSRKGSDRLPAGRLNGLINFNPRSRKGSDGDCFSKALTHIQFQSTLPQGERRQVRARTSSSGYISIHAPARGATQVRCAIRTPYEFQSTLPQGERRSAKSTISALLLFQSTLPQGERLSGGFPAG